MRFSADVRCVGSVIPSLEELAAQPEKLRALLAADQGVS